MSMSGHGLVDCDAAWCEARVGKGMSSARNSSCRAISESVLRAINWSRGWNSQTIGRGESAEDERNLHSVQLREIGGLGVIQQVNTSHSSAWQNGDTQLSPDCLASDLGVEGRNRKMAGRSPSVRERKIVAGRSPRDYGFRRP